MATAGEGETSYRGGAGGKFQKRTARRHQTTPYDRPPSIVRNTRPGGGWVSKLLDPASKFISARAFKFFSNFRKRLTEAEQETKDEPREAALSLVDCNGAREQNIAYNGNIANSSEGSGISDLEQMLQQKTFTRSEIDHLTELLHSRTTEISLRDEEKRNEGNLLKPISDIEKSNLFTRSPLQENRNESNKFQMNGVSSRVLEDDIASPAELAKAYMGSRPSKVSPSILGVRSQAFKEETPLFKNGVFPSKTSAPSLVSKSVLRDGVPERSFTTPKSRGRSAIYKMAQTPYSRGTGSTKYIYGGPSSSSPQSAWEHNGQFGSKQLALKRRSSVLDDDSGSVSAIRSIRQKPNLSYHASRLSARGTDFGYSANQHHTSLKDKPLLLDDAKNKVSKNGEECEDDSIAGSRYFLVPSQSHQMASKILQQLEKFTPPEKSSESKLISARGDSSPIKLTSNMLRGQALRSLENSDMTKLLQNQNGETVEDSSNALPNAGGEASCKKKIVEENGLKESNIPLKLTASLVGANATISMTNAVPNIKNGDSIVSKFAAQPQTKRGFRMSANEDFPELDDDTHTNGFVSVCSGEGREGLQTSLKSVSPRAIAVEKISAKPEGKILENLASNGTNDLKSKGTDDLKITGGPVAHKENTGIQTPAVVAPNSNFQQDIPVQSTSVVNNSVPFRDISCSPTLSGLSSKNVDTLPSFTFSSPCGESSGPNPIPLSDSRRQCSNSFGNDAQLRTRESDRVDDKNTHKAKNVSWALDNSTSAAVSASTASGFVSSNVSAENLNNGVVASSPLSIPSTAHKLPLSNSTEQVFGSSSTIVHSLTSAAMTSGSSSTTSGPSIFSVAPSFPAAPATSPSSFPSEPVAAPIFSFGSSKTASNPVATVLTATGAETTGVKSNDVKESLFSNSNKLPSSGTLFATNAGNNSFGFSSLASSSSNNESQVSLSGFGSSSPISSQFPPTTGATTVPQSVPFQFGTSSTSFTTNSSVIGSSVAPANPFGSATTTLSTTTSPFSNTPNSSSGTSSSIFSSSWQTSKSPVMGSAASSPSPSTLFSFGASSTMSTPTSSVPTVFGQSAVTSSVSTFSFTSPTATTSSLPSLSQSQSLFGSTAAPRAPGNSGDQMNMEDSMAEDPVHSSNPAVPVFGQPSFSSSNPTVPVFGQGLVSQSPPGFMFGSTAPPPPFQFGGQQNQATPQNLPSFQASNSLDFNSGGSFSLGSGGGDKSSRKTVRVSRNRNRKK